MCSPGDTRETVAERFAPNFNASKKHDELEHQIKIVFERLGILV